MSDQKITVSLDEVNSSYVDNEIHRQDMAQRMAEHQEKIRISFGGSGEMPGAKGGFFRKAIVYMAIFGLISSILGWGASELFSPDKIKKDPIYQALKAVDFYIKENPHNSDRDLRFFLKNLKENMPEMKDNEYLPDKILNISKEEIHRLTIRKAINATLWHLSLSLFISVGLAIAENIMAGNPRQALRNGLIGGILGLAGGFIVSLFVDQIYSSLGGGSGTCPFIQQVCARSIGWGILGLFMAIAPGITMKSPKKFILGLIGGAIGGLLGGMLFDITGRCTGGAVLSRFINITGLGVGAAVATALLENATKQGWLKVAAGLIAGKQFILYRNPTVIGSSPKCEIYLFKDPSVASKHAAINSRNGDFLITAINGATVLVNNAPVIQQKLKTGDRIGIGCTSFIFEAKTLRKK